MYIIYYDEAGDDGRKAGASQLFTLASVAINQNAWKDGYRLITDFRKTLKNTYAFPVNLEMHTMDFLLNKNPYLKLNLTVGHRIQIISDYCGLIAQLPINIINVAINKKIIRNSVYSVLDNAFTYSIQRVDNYLSKIDGDEKFIIVLDEGRYSIMRKTARKVQKINFIPSHFQENKYNAPIARLIEDPMTKKSKESYFIQIADLVTSVVFLYEKLILRLGSLAARMPSEVNVELLQKWLELLTPVLNLDACKKDKFGIACYPDH